MQQNAPEVGVETADVLTSLNNMLDSFVQALPRVGVALIVFLLIYFIARLLTPLIKRVGATTGLSRQALTAVARLTRWTITIVGLLVALVIIFPTFGFGQLIELLGIGGVAIGFAFRDIIQNFLAGILLLLTEPFQVGDQIIVNEYEGTVHEIETRATKIKTYDNRLVVIPNSDLFTDSIIVNTAFPHRRLQYDIGIGYGDDVEQARQLMLEAMHETEGVLEDPAPDVRVVELGDFAVKLRARWWIDPTKRAEAVAVQDEVLTNIKQKLVSGGIDLPFPTHQILFHDQTEETDGDRARQREGWPAPANGQPPQARKISDALGQGTGD